MSTVMQTKTATPTSQRSLGYQRFSAGQFTFERDEYFAHIFYPGGRHLIPIDAFLRSLMRDVAWGFFYGTVNFDTVFGTINHYGTVDMFIGLLNEAYFSANLLQRQPALRGDLRIKGSAEGIHGDAGGLDQPGFRSVRRAR